VNDDFAESKSQQVPEATQPEQEQSKHHDEPPYEDDDVRSIN